MEKRKLQYSTFETFIPHFNALARVGYYKRLDEPSKNGRKLHNVYMIFSFCIVFLYNIQHVIRVYLTRHSTDLMVDTLFVLLTTISTLGKHVTFILKSSRIDHLINVIKGPLFAPTKPAHVDILKSNAVVMSRLLLLHHCMIFLCGSLWAIFPIVNRVLGIDVQFTAYFPFDTSVSPMFELSLAYMSILITFQAYGNVTMDCTVVALYSQADTQLQLLSYDLQRFTDLPIYQDSAKTETMYLDADIHKEVLRRRYVRCVEHYKNILWFTKEVESIFEVAMIVQIASSSWVICMTVYKMVDLSMFSPEFFSMAMYLCCMLTQLFIYCYFGTKLQMQSQEVSLSLYRSNWLELSPGFRRLMLVTMVRSRRAVVPSAAFVIPLSLETYIAVLRLSYTLYTFLEKK